MNRNLFFMACLILFSLSLSSISFAGAYEIYEHGARATGIAGAYTAIAKGPSAIFYNPAGITQGAGLQLMLGTTLVKPFASFTSAQAKKTEQESQLYYPSHFYLTYQFTEKLSAGFGFFSPFGLGTKWPEDWTGKYRAVKTDLKTFYLNPTIAYQLTPKISLAAGFDYIVSMVELTQKIPTGTPFGDVDLELTGDGNAMSFNAGLLFKATEKINAGVSFRYAADIEYDGDAKYTVPNAALAPAFVNSSGTAEIHMPYILTAGVSFMPMEKWTFAFDFNWYGWSGADSITMTFDKAPGNPAVPYKTALKQEYDDSFLLRIGAEYQLNQTLCLRAGYIYDQSPVKDE
ncbi:MAG: outer membrane protein transport protein, partial [candidate division KSB1 bacterium]|nr:outer membrane protein transport protein [candidate division KSB1 bacterium]